MEVRLKNLDHLFKPRTIAFVGATETTGKWGNIVFKNILGGGFSGKLIPINPGRDEVFGHKAYPSVRDIPEEVDMALFTVPAMFVLDAVKDCVAKGVKAGMIISAGFKELGDEGAAMEAEIVETARAGGMVLAGPNGQGVACPSSSLYAWMPDYYPPAGKIGVISQSGNIQSIIIDAVVKSGFGISKTVSSGNEADIHSADYFSYLAEDDDTEVILSYLEGVTDGRRFFKTVKDVTKKKPIVVVKGGITEAGQSAANSHTGAMAGSSRIFEAACRQSGIILADSIKEAGIIASSFINRTLPSGNRVGILTGGGGLGVMASDWCSKLGLEVADLSEKTLSEIGENMPKWWVPGNPVDLVAGLNFQIVLPVITTMMESGEIDSLLLLFIGPPRGQGKDPSQVDEKMKAFQKTMAKMFKGFVQVLGQQSEKTGIPVYTVSNFTPEPKSSGKDEQVINSNATMFPDIISACKAIKAGADFEKYRKNL
jgi:acetate---CoA ligase (ADP-forming)